MAHIHEDDGSHISHDDCPRWSSPPEGETWPACYVGAVAEDNDDPEEEVWSFLESLPAGGYRMTTIVTTYRGREDDPVVEYLAEGIPVRLELNDPIREEESK